ncbi:MAG: hypothetical protein IJP92_06100 [Lachnospiraceae bacterium]|nr:hypothetical protein [Lachnospiraceae bacterium]
MIGVLRKYRRIPERYLFPLLLFLWPFVGLFRSFDLRDASYSLGYFQYGAQMDPMWYLATYLANLFGKLLTLLPFGGTYAGMNVWATLLICAMALSAYYLLGRFELPRWMIFIAEWIAVSLCWCPRVILYNYLTYALFTGGTLLLLYGLVSVHHPGRLLVMAGVLYGLNVHTRFPNILECCMIVTVVAYGIWTKQGPGLVLKRIGLCVAGYAAGFLIPYLVIRIRYGETAYADMVSALLGLTAESPQHGAGGMLGLIAGAYGRTLSHMAILIPCIAAGVVMFVWKKDSFVQIKRLLYMAGIGLLCVFYFKQGVFTFNYWYYDCMFQAAMMFVIFAVLLFVLDIAGLLGGHEQERLLSLTALMIILITPLGSDNYTYPVLNNLFLVAPAALGTFRRAQRKTLASRHREAHFTWGSMMAAMALVLFVQGSIFHAVFVYGGEKDVRYDTKITGIPKAEGMITSEEKAGRLENLYAFLAAQELTGKPTLLFGDIPGMSYLFDLPPAIFTTWPDLDSNSVERFDTALGALDTLPQVLVSSELIGATQQERKEVLLQTFLLQRAYDKIYDDGVYRMYEWLGTPAQGDAP